MGKSCIPYQPNSRMHIQDQCNVLDTCDGNYDFDFEHEQDHDEADDDAHENQSNVDKEESIIVVNNNCDDDSHEDHDEADDDAHENQYNVDMEESIIVVNNNCDDDSHEGSLIGLKRKNLDEIYKLYNNHAAQVGFGIRKSTTKYNVKRVLVSKLFVCSSYGTRDTKICSSKKTYVTRTNCMASLKAKLNKDDGLYEIVEHHTEHNHTLCRRELSYMHRSQRSISSEKALMIEDMVSSGIRCVDSFRYMAYDAGGEHLVGHTQKDHENFVNRLKMKAIDGGDAQTVIDNLTLQGAKDPDFFYRFKLDSEGRLCNVFWRDSMMKEDYGIYGDVVVFDTTYRTNRYNLICAPFVGINNHWKNVMFGCAFISNEKIESFEWLFEVFKKSMGGKAPISIFTDQDLAISNAIQSIFPSTRHRLCIWHLYQNAISRFGKLKSNKPFNDAFNKCLSGCANEQDFEMCWSAMISRFGIEDNTWFQRLYELRLKWCTGYNKDYFSAGILSSQRSESTNSAIGFKAKKTTSLTDFFTIFERTVKRWRSNEANDEFQCSKLIPTSILPMQGLLKHASEVYTLTLFKEFEKEFIKSVSTLVKLLDDEDGMKYYEVSDDDKIMTTHHVSFYTVDVMVSCSCKKFEECGLLCYHSLRVMHVHSITQIPRRYILRRWEKLAKQDVWGKYDTTSEQFENSNTFAPWRHQMMRKYYNIVLKAQENAEARTAMENATHIMATTVDELVTAREDEAIEVSGSSTMVLNPSHSNTKGRKKKRIKSHHKSKKVKTSGDGSAASMEFGTKTPNLRLL